MSIKISTTVFLKGTDLNNHQLLVLGGGICVLGGHSVNLP